MSALLAAHAKRFVIPENVLDYQPVDDTLLPSVFNAIIEHNIEREIAGGYLLDLIPPIIV